MTTPQDAATPSGDRRTAARSRRTPTAVPVVVVGLILLAWCVLWLPRRAEERRLRMLMSFLDPAHELAWAAQKVKQKTGAYPKTETAFSALVDAQGKSLVTAVATAMAASGHEAYSQFAGAGSGGLPPGARPTPADPVGRDPSALYTFEGSSHRLQILPGGRVGVTAQLAPAVGSRPSWLKVTETVEEPEGFTQ